MDPEQFRKRLLEIRSKQSVEPVKEEKPIIEGPKIHNMNSNQGRVGAFDENFSLAQKPEGVSHEGGLRTIATDMARAVREQEL